MSTKRPADTEPDNRIKKKRSNLRHALTIFGVMLLLAGLQMGILVSPVFMRLSEFFRINIILLYWAAVTAIFVFITNREISRGYDDPMRKLGEATKRVSEGDFSVYVEPLHSADKYDYIDVMLLDFNKMVEELGSIETLKNDFVSNVSHELKTPLAVIRNYTDMLQRKNLPEEIREDYMHAIIEATDRLSILISNILKLNKLDNQAIEPVALPYDLCRQLTECFLQFEPLWDEKKLEIEVDIEERRLIVADESMMEIVWNNLFSNAIKFTDPGGKISIKQTADMHSITVSVSDTGCGMTDDVLRHIFDKFYQGDTSHSGEGNGLGLALANRVIEKSGGTLAVKSEVGKGSTFTVQLPVTGDETSDF